MWPPGHAAVGYLCYSLGADRDRLPEIDATVVVALLVGTQFPDLVDKPLAWYLGVLPGGRTLGHSLLFLVPVVAVVGLALARRDATALGVAFGVGALLHVLVDAVPVLWDAPTYWEHLLWPVTGGHTAGPDEQYTILGLLRAQATQPWFLVEYAFVAAALVRWRADGLPGVEWLRGLREESPAAQGR